MFDFKSRLKELPENPGVYLMKNNLGEVIYVGKAKNLKNRVRSYFRNSKNHTEKVKAMVKNIAEFEYIITDSEMEALILECNLIKKYSPRYNILLKDDKTYPFIKITINEDFPKVFMTRNFAKDRNKYFGPYPDGKAVYETLNLIKSIFPLRTCRKFIKESDPPQRPCLNYHIKKCNAPCGKFISKENYRIMINDIIELLSGRDKTIIKDLTYQMEEASKKLEFEKAASLRDKIAAINTIAEKQKIFKSNDTDEDFINIFKDEKDCAVQVFFYREGKISGREKFILENQADTPDEEIFSQFIASFYKGTPKVPKTINIPQTDMEDLDVLEEFLTVKRGSKVYIKMPQKGEKKEILELVKNNAEITLTKFRTEILKEKQANLKCLDELVELLDLPYPPERIEAYDISNIQGVDSVGSMIVFENGKAKNSDYRRFKIKTVKNSNDYESMREILTRRFSHGLKEIKEIQEKKIEFSAGKFSNFPDLIMMDGGRGQVNIALEVLDSLNINIPVCGLVKDDHHATRGIIYNNEELIINRSSDLMQLIRRVQDEAHRFAITYHRSLRDKKTLHSILDDIPNIGKKRRMALLMKFGSIDNIKNASKQELLDTESIDNKAAESILVYFKNNQQN